MRWTEELSKGYSVEFGSFDELTWSGVVLGFADASIYQTSPYEMVLSGKRNTRHMVLSRDGETVAAAQTRVRTVRPFGRGIAYVRWGPLWRVSGRTADPEVFRQALRALRNEYVCRLGLVLRVLPRLYHGRSDETDCLQVMEEEGFAHLEPFSGRTLMVDLRPDLQRLRAGMRQKWRNCLNQSERNGLQILEGDGDDLFESFIEIYREMLDRKKFQEPNDINQFRAIQQKLPERLKMRVFLAKLDDVAVSGAIYSSIGNTGVYLFGATRTAGMTQKGSYLLQWRAIQWMKELGLEFYDLNGINPETNPGTYRFKEGLCGKNGRDTRRMGASEAYPSKIEMRLMKHAEKLRLWMRGTSPLAAKMRDLMKI